MVFDSPEPVQHILNNKVSRVKFTLIVSASSHTLFIRLEGDRGFPPSKHPKKSRSIKDGSRFFGDGFGRKKVTQEHKYRKVVLDIWFHFGDELHSLIRIVSHSLSRCSR